MSLLDSLESLIFSNQSGSLLDAVKSFGGDSIKQVPFKAELLNGTIDAEKLTIPELISAVESAAYLNLPTTKLLEEFFWKIGVDEATHNQWVNGSNGSNESAVVFQNEKVEYLNSSKENQIKN